MAMIFKIKKAVCISLSHACLILGFLDLLANILLIVHCSIRLHEIFDPKLLTMLIGAIVGVCTCLLMICGSMMEKRWLLVPHMTWVIYPIISFAINGLTMSIFLILDESVLTALRNAVIGCCVISLCFYYWIVMFNRFREIKEKQSAPAVLVEMQ